MEGAEQGEGRIRQDNDKIKLLHTITQELVPTDFIRSAECVPPFRDYKSREPATSLPFHFLFFSCAQTRVRAGSSFLLDVKLMFDPWKEQEHCNICMYIYKTRSGPKVGRGRPWSRAQTISKSMPSGQVGGGLLWKGCAKAIKMRIV